MAAGGADMVDAALFPHTCDSIQGLASLAPAWGGWSKPAFRFIHPKGDLRASLRTFLEAELRALATQLASLTGREVRAEALAEAIALHDAIDGVKHRLLRERRHLPLADRDLYALLRRGEYLWPTDHLAELRDAEAQLTEAPVQNGVPLMVTGYVPEPAALFDILGEAGALIVADDYAAVGRRVVSQPPAAQDDPVATLAERQLAAPPCPTRGQSQATRIDYLSRLFHDSGAAGVVVHTVKFCEPELFDVPAIRKHFSAANVPVLLLEGELEAELSGQMVTRIEAFVEMVESARSAA